MIKQRRMDQLYMDVAFRCADESHDVRRRVGCVVVQDNAIISMGWNGTPEGASNECSDHFLRVHPDGQLYLFAESKPSVVHAEMNAMAKLASSTLSARGATVYCTDQPCIRCAIALSSARIKEFVYAKPYRDLEGLEHLVSKGIAVRSMDL